MDKKKVGDFMVCFLLLICKHFPVEYIFLMVNVCKGFGVFVVVVAVGVF